MKKKEKTVLTTTFRNENHRVAEFVFDIMRKSGFKPYNIEYGDTYFMFTGDADSVIHFRVKGVWKHWRFGMWIHSEYLDEAVIEEEKSENLPWGEGNKVVILFAQYDTQIDKFKPSCSALCVEKEAREWSWDEDNWYELDNMLNMMRYHPFMCYNSFCGEYAGFYSRRSFLWPFVKYETYDIWRKLREAVNVGFWGPYTRLKCYFARKDKCISKLECVDFEKENPGWSTSHRFEVRVTFTEAATEKEEVNWLNKWFKRDDYGKYSCFGHAVHLEALRKEGRKGFYSYVNG